MIHDRMDRAGNLIYRRKADAERKRGKEPLKKSSNVLWDVQRLSAGHPHPE